MESKNIYQRLNEVMKEVEYVQKESKKVNNQYTFVSHDAVTGAVRPFFVKHGIVYHPVDMVVKENGNRTEAQFKVRFVNIDTPTDFIDVPTFGYGIDPQDKGPGKAMSYGVKYAVLKTLGLETGDDPERASIDHNPKASVTPPLKKSEVEQKGLPDWVEAIAKKEGRCDYCNSEPIKEGAKYAYHAGLRKAYHIECREAEKAIGF